MRQVQNWSIKKELHGRIKGTTLQRQKRKEGQRSEEEVGRCKET